MFGLGDSSYAKFNMVARRLYKRLSDIGAEPIFVLGDGNEQHPVGYDGELVPWLEGFWDELLYRYPMPAGLTIIGNDVLYGLRNHIQETHR